MVHLGRDRQQALAAAIDFLEHADAAGDCRPPRGQPPVSAADAETLNSGRYGARQISVAV